jgi:hypothetical protein
VRVTEPKPQRVDVNAAAASGGRASFSRCGVYRYALHRAWDDARPRVCFCMLNPSTADAHRLDPTVRRCLGFAHAWGFGALEVVNIFALRSTDPAGLRAVNDPVGPGNDAAIRRAARRSALVIAAWGAHGALLDRGERVLTMLQQLGPVHALVRTAAGHPGHPLYVSAAARPMRL